MDSTPSTRRQTPDSLLICTQVGARALARISVVWHGIFAGPWYASLSARGGTGPALPVIYALALQLAFNALLQVAFGLEDPYARAGGRGLHDSVRVRGRAAARKSKIHAHLTQSFVYTGLLTSRARRWSGPRGKRVCPGTPTWVLLGKNVNQNTVH